MKEKHGYGVRFAISNTDKEIINWLIKTFGGNTTVQRKAGTLMDGQSYKSNKDMHIWYLHIDKVKNLLAELIPYLKIKKQQAILLYEYMMKRRRFCGRSVKCPLWYREWQEDFYKRIQKLNKPSVDIPLMPIIDLPSKWFG